MQFVFWARPKYLVNTLFPATMKKKLFFKSLVIIPVLLTGMILLNQCKQSAPSRLPEPPSAEFSNYISAFSGGILPTDQPIQIRFAFDMIDSASIGSRADDGLIQTRPTLQGSTWWKDSRTLEFRPEEKLPHDQIFHVHFYLSKLIPVDDPYKTFTFGFATMPQSANLRIEKLECYYANNQPMLRIAGVVETADAAMPTQVRDILGMGKGFSSDQPVAWQHRQQNRRHYFTLEDIPRGNQAGEWHLEWNFRSLGLREKGVEKIALPAPGTFELVHMHFEQLPEPRISLQFSEPLREGQNLGGLLYFADKKNLNTRIQGNEIIIFAPENLSGRQILTIEPSLRDHQGRTLASRQMRELVFEDLKPAVRLVGRGVILPSSGEILFPFEAVNLAAVDVDIVRIYEDNMLQFLQLNQLDGNDQLRRVGRIVARRTLALSSTEVTNLHQWNQFAIDLSQVIEPEPGAVYRVYISYKRDYSLYPCGEDHATSKEYLLASLDKGWESISDEVRYWGSYDEYRYYHDYNWRERDNPCHNTYYYNKSISRNILASNLGIIAKKQTDNTYHFAVTDLQTARPMQGVKLELYNFQQQIMETITTDRNGFASVKSRGTPFVVVASKDQQRGYLRVDDGTSLSLSMFDVDGTAMQQGMKAFVYGERGVWRPGDTLFLNFVLEDKKKQLPEKFPVVFRLYNPLGQIVHSQVHNDGVNGFYHFRPVTDPDAPTGNYTASFKLGGVEFTQSLRVETIMPNRLRIDTDFAQNRLEGFQPVRGNLRAEWLHGATARNLRAEVTATLNPSRTRFENYKEYVFDDPSRSFHSETFPLFQGRLNAQGEAQIQTRINVGSRAPGVLAAAIETKVYEEGGAFSVDRFQLPFYPFQTYAGVALPQVPSTVLLTDTVYQVRLVNVNQDGEAVKRSRLRADVYKIHWRWWWDASSEYLGDFSAGSYNQPIATQVLDVYDGKAAFEFSVEYPDWGRYLVLVTDLESGHRSGDFMYFDWPSWYGATRDGRQQAAAMLSFTTDKEQYSPGEEMVFTFPSSKGGRALVSIENGSGVLHKQWVETQDGHTVFRMKATREMAPNAFAHITLLQPHAQTINDLPIRLYGIMPLKVFDPKTVLTPVIDMPDVLKPQQQVSISVKEKQGQPMTYTLAMVDEGLLDLTRFRTPDPWAHFNAREALGVKTWDMFDHVMGAFGSEFSRLLGIGGDDFIQPPVAGERASRFTPVVRFFGPFALEKGKSQTHTFTMPQYAGSVRVMVVAGQDGTYGKAEKTVPVRQSLMAIGTLPRVLGPGERVVFPVNVFALDESVTQADVSIAANDLLTIRGEANQRVTFSQPGDKLAWFELETPQKEGVARITTTVKSGRETVSFDIELQVRNANPRLTSVENYLLDAGESQSIAFELTGMTATREAVLELSSIPPLNLEKRLRFLMAYPHGCTEQITSAVFPQLYLETFQSLSDQEKEKIQSNVSVAITRLQGRQLSNGGVTTWPGGNMANEWVSSYTGHFMLEARKKGFTVSTDFIDNWARFQKDMANRWMAQVEGMGNDLMQAYRLYTLALAGKAELGAMNRLRQLPQLSVQARWMLAGAYQLAAQQEAALQLIRDTETTVSPYTQQSFTYGNHIRDKAMILQVLVRLNQREQAAYLVREISEAFASERWLSTQTTAFGLMAMADFYGGYVPDSGIKAGFSEDGGTEETLQTEALLYLRELSIPATEDQKRIRLSNQSESPLYARVIHSGIPLAGQEQARAENLRMSARFTSLDGQTLDVRRLKQGTSFIAEVTLTHPGIRGNYKELALTRIFPSGWEISNIRMDAAAAAIQQDSPDYEDVRDDRVYTYFNLAANQTQSYKVMLTATYEGRFYLPAFNVEAMYDASVYARNQGMWVEVVRE